MGNSNRPIADNYESDIIKESMKTVSVKEMQKLDRVAIEDRGIPSITLMENAGRAVGVEIREISAPISIDHGLIIDAIF